MGREWTPLVDALSRGFPKSSRDRRARNGPGRVAGTGSIGVRQSIADLLADEAFLQRHGTESSSTAATISISGIPRPCPSQRCDRQSRQELRRRVPQLDYNITPAPARTSTPRALAPAFSHTTGTPGVLDSVLDRYPRLDHRRTAPHGAMRMDFAMLSRVAMQSTSDHRTSGSTADRRGRTLVDAARTAANWAYPQRSGRRGSRLLPRHGFARPVSTSPAT